MRRKRSGVADYRFGARLYSEIAQPLRVSFACSRKADDSSRDCIARWIDHAPVMQSLDGELECDAQETRGLWIELLPIKILSDRHDENSNAPVAPTLRLSQGLMTRRRQRHPGFTACVLN